MSDNLAFPWDDEFQYDYIESADILEIFFSAEMAVDSVELTEDVTLFLDGLNHPVSLILNNYTYLIEPTPFGPRGFRLEIDQLPQNPQVLVRQIIMHPPVSRVLHTLTYLPAPEVEPIPIAAIAV